MNRVFLAALAAMVLIAGGTGSISAQMPDVRQMSGMPLPVPDASPGTVTVRVIRGALTSVVPNQPVDLIGGPSTLTVKTNDAGRAEFSGLTPGTRVRAVTVVGSERLESQEFEVPRTGGIRLLLVATDPGAAKQAAEDQKLAQAPAQPGTVVLGGESRIVFEVGDDGLNVFYMLQVVNAQKTPVSTEPLVFELPADAEHASILEGSSPQAVAAGKRVTVTGPFTPGATTVQFAYTLDMKSSERTVRQTLPAPLTQVTVLVQKLGEMHVASEQFAQHRDISSDGQSYILGQGPALKAGDTLTLSFTGLPAPPVWPRNLALFLAALILVAGAWAASRPRRESADFASRVTRLQARRERLFAQLADLEKQRKAAAIDEGRYDERRRELVSALERVYAELDEQAAA